MLHFARSTDNRRLKMNRYNNDSYYEPEDELTEEELEELELELDETDFIDEDDWERGDE
jgi:hypothetical protein